MALTELATIAESTSAPVPVDKLAATVARLTTQHRDAQNDLDARRLKHENLLVQRAIDDKTLDDALVAISRREVDAAREKADALTAALMTARAQLSAREAATWQEARAAAWRHAVDLAGKRNDHLAKLERSLAQFAEDYREALHINEELVAALPSNPDSAAAITDRMTLETALRKELCRKGLPWAFTWPYGTVNLPDLLPQFEGALTVVSQWAESSR